MTCIRISLAPFPRSSFKEGFLCQHFRGLSQNDKSSLYYLTHPHCCWGGEKCCVVLLGTISQQNHSKKYLPKYFCFSWWENLCSEPSQDVILHHKQSLQSAVPLQFCLFSKIQISQTLKEFRVERRDKESECGCRFTAKPPSSLLLWRALNADMVYLWGVKIEPNFYV